MSEIIVDGTGQGFSVKVDGEGRFHVFAISESLSAHVSNHDGQCYALQAVDTGPTAGEYTIYLKNDSDTNLTIDEFLFWATDADVVWKITKVTGTAGGAAVITPNNLNFTSGNDADVTARGGAGGVTGLSVSSVVWTLYHGIALSHFIYPASGRVVLGKNDAIAVEYDAGTGGAATVGIVFHYRDKD